MEVVPILLCVIQKISSVRLYHPKDLKDAAKRNSMLKTVDVIRVDLLVIRNVKYCFIGGKKEVPRWRSAAASSEGHENQR